MVEVASSSSPMPERDKSDALFDFSSLIMCPCHLESALQISDAVTINVRDQPNAQ